MFLIDLEDEESYKENKVVLDGLPGLAGIPKRKTNQQ